MEIGTQMAPLQMSRRVWWPQMGRCGCTVPRSGITSPRGTVDQCTLTLNNMDGRYSPLNTSSPIYDDIKLGGAYHAPMYLRVSIDGGSNYDRVFTGVIKIPREEGHLPQRGRDRGD